MAAKRCSGLHFLASIFLPWSFLWEPLELSGQTAFGNTPKAAEVASRFAAKMKLMREILFEKGKETFSVSQHEFLTYCDLQEDRCVLIVHVPDLRHFSDSAKGTLGA
jgi:hypothetical protein